MWGHDDLDTFIPFADAIHLDGVIEHITVPLLIAHGANDRQLPRRYAHRSYDHAVHSPKRKLRIFTPEEGGAEHIGLGHLPHVSTFIADWIADTFAATPPPHSLMTAGAPNGRAVISTGGHRYPNRQRA